MIFKDILEKAVGIICDEDIDLDTESAKRTKLISCGNMIYSELTEEYVRLFATAEVIFTDGKVYYNAFPKSVKDIISVYKNGIKQDFTIYPAYILSDITGVATVKYVYHGEELTLKDTVDLPPQFNAIMLSYGVASEYFYRSGLIDEAAFYKNRYDTSVVNLTRKQKSIDLKVKRFI